MHRLSLIQSFALDTPSKFKVYKSNLFEAGFCEVCVHGEPAYIRYSKSGMSGWLKATRRVTRRIDTQRLQDRLDELYSFVDK